MAGSAQKRFGTVSGVFIPNVLTIFGVILFYREGWVVANAGLLGSILIIILANVITFTTALSMSAIVTNIQIKGGGAYFLISRSLGPEFGGAVGIALYFAQAFSISFYIIGFTLSLHMLLPHVPMWILNTATLAVLTLLSIFSAEIAIKAQYIILALVLVALASFFIGNFEFSHPETTSFGPYLGGNFWKTFAIFFPAVTGIFAGLSLSGDLKEPHRNIPKGTISAILFTFVFYILVAVFYALNFDMPGLLASDIQNGTNLIENLMLDSAKWRFLVIGGIWAATLSSAIGVLLGAPRTLQALARDELVPSFLGKGSGPANEPRVAMLISIVLAEVLLLLGNIDFIAQLLTMFFLATYGIVNLIAAFEVIVGNPAYRPKMKVHWSISLFGGIASFAVMFLIDPLSTLVALVIIISIYVLMTRRQLQKNWGDIRKGFWATVIEIALTNYEKYKEHPRNWRPHIAIFENNKISRSLLIELASLISGKSGIVSNYMFFNAPVAESERERMNAELEEVREYTTANKIPFIYPEVILTNHDKNSDLITLQADGIGTFKANTIISDFYLTDKSLDDHLTGLQAYDFLKKNVVLVKDNHLGLRGEDRIDIWISGFKANLSLMLMIPFLITKNPEWSNTEIYLRMVVRTNSMKKKMESNMKTILSHGRINAHIEVTSLNIPDENESAKERLDIVPEKERPHGNIFSRIIHFVSHLEQTRFGDPERKRIREIIIETSKNARMVIMGVNVPAKGKEAAYANELRTIMQEMPITLLVKGNHNINLFL